MKRSGKRSMNATGSIPSTARAKSGSSSVCRQVSLISKTIRSVRSRVPCDVAASSPKVLFPTQISPGRISCAAESVRICRHRIFLQRSELRPGSQYHERQRICRVGSDGTQVQVPYPPRSFDRFAKCNAVIGTVKCRTPSAMKESESIEDAQMPKAVIHWAFWQPSPPRCSATANDRPDLRAHDSD